MEKITSAEKVTNEQEFWAFMAKLTEERERRDAELKAISAQTDLKIQALTEKIAKTDEQLAKTDAQLAKTDEQLAKTDAQLAKTDEQLAKTDAQLAKTDEQLAKTDAQLAETDARLNKLFAKTDAQMAKTDAQMAKTDAQLAKTDERLNKLFAKTDAQMAKTDAQMAKTDAQLAKTDERLNKLFAKTDAQMAKTDAQMAKTDAQLAKTDERLNKLSELIGGIANNQGQVAEEFFYHSLANRLQVADIKFDAIYRNLGGRINGLQDEFDLILVNGDVLAMFEVKTKAHVNLIDTMLQRKIPNLRKVLPCFKDYKIYAGIASLVTYDELIGRAKEQGLFLLTQQGDHIEVINQNVRDF